MPASRCPYCMTEVGVVGYHSSYAVTCHRCKRDFIPRFHSEQQEGEHKTTGWGGDNEDRDESDSVSVPSGGFNDGSSGGDTFSGGSGGGFGGGGASGDF